MKITDEEIKEKIREQLLWDDRINDTHIFINIKDGNIKFDGFISSYYMKTLVTQNAKKIYGVISIENNLEVRYLPVPEKGIPSDNELQNIIEKSLKLNANMDRSNISVKVNRGVVTLEGVVYTYWKRNIVLSIVSEFNGVINIVNKISIAHFEHKDENINEDIVNTLERYPNVNVEDINIVVKDGIVSVSGKVGTWEEYDAVLEAIYYTHGVKGINNNIILEISNKFHQ
ncbi:MAG: BON domain-containing protein [Candidatus Thorarchaeota archaeon]